jgi:hypothetical protein
LNHARLTAQLAGSTLTVGATLSSEKRMASDDLQGFIAQARPGQNLLELGVLHFQRPQVFGVGPVYPAELLAPDVKRGVAEAVSAAQLLDRHTGFRFAQETNDLLLG